MVQPPRDSTPRLTDLKQKYWTRPSPTIHQQEEGTPHLPRTVILPPRPRLQWWTPPSRRNVEMWTEEVPTTGRCLRTGSVLPAPGNHSSMLHIMCNGRCERVCNLDLIQIHALALMQITPIYPLVLGCVPPWASSVHESSSISSLLSITPTARVLYQDWWNMHSGTLQSPRLNQVLLFYSCCHPRSDCRALNQAKNITFLCLTATLRFESCKSLVLMCHLD